MDKINVITLCSGYDSQCMALERIKKDFGLDYDLTAWSEIDRYACQAHDAVFPQFKGRNLGDMTAIDWSQIKEQIDLLVYSTPCQSISSAGLQHGFKEGSGTRSSIIWSTLNAIDVLKPKYLLLENVKAMVSRKFLPDFKSWLDALEERGYKNYWQVLNAKDYGVPQNRERVFVVSILGDEQYQFPKPFELKLRLKDVIESNIDEKYYLSKKMINTFHGGGKEIKIVTYTRDKKGKVVNRRLVDVANTVHTSTGSGGNTDSFVAEPNENLEQYRIRKLTERECFRLMGVTDADIDKIQSAGISKTQQYRQAGNSIVVDVLYHIFRKLFIDKTTIQITLF